MKKPDAQKDSREMLGTLAFVSSRARHVDAEHCGPVAYRAAASVCVTFESLESKLEDTLLTISERSAQT